MWHAGRWTGAEASTLCKGQAGQAGAHHREPAAAEVQATEHEIAAAQCVNVSSRSTLSNLTLDKAVAESHVMAKQSAAVNQGLRPDQEDSACNRTCSGPVWLDTYLRHAPTAIRDLITSTPRE